MAANLAAAGLTPKFADVVNMHRPKGDDNAMYAGWYAFQHPGGEFEVCLRPGGVFHATGFPAASRWCALPGPNPAIAITWGKYGDYKLDVTDGVLRELAGSRVPAAGRAPGPNDWRRMRCVRPLSPAETKLLAPDGGGTAWAFHYANGRFEVQFRGDGFNHFTCHQYPAHSHWTLANDELTISWGQFGTYVLRVDGGDPAKWVGGLKENPAEWRKMTYLRDLAANEAEQACGHDHNH
mmetsp:Transcript_34434/g.103774  ORF Transcript_34434/g.103774 Transcript_34434/m.103774 type:complete len:237 (-) Transcript_34434:45-755(-)